MPPSGRDDSDGVAAPAARELARDREPEAGAGRRRCAPRGRGGSARTPRVLLAGRQAGAVVEHLDARADRAQHDVAAARRVGDRVLHQHVERAVEVGAARPRRRPPRRSAVEQADAGGARGALPAPAASATASARSTASPGSSRSPVRLRTSRSSIVCDIRSSSSARRRGARAGLGLVGRRLRLLHPQPHAGQRRAQLVRRVGDELRLRAQQRAPGARS